MARRGLIQAEKQGGKIHKCDQTVTSGRYTKDRKTTQPHGAKHFLMTFSPSWYPPFHLRRADRLHGPLCACGWRGKCVAPLLFTG